MSRSRTMDEILMAVFLAILGGRVVPWRQVLETRRIARLARVSSQFDQCASERVATSLLAPLGALT